MALSAASFAGLGLSPALQRALAERGHVLPTPIQAAAIPAALAGRDVLGAAQTGSGKTLAYALPLLQNIARATPALVLVPTRELAAQVGETIQALARHGAARIKVVTAFGGVSINPQMMALRGGADVLIATPGRLLDLVDQNAVRLGGVAVLVLDEADRLLGEGFADELAGVLALLPAKRQTLLFSATFPPPVRTLADELLTDPERIDVPATPGAEPDIEQRAIRVDAPRRTALLRRLIEQHRWPRVLVFVATRYASEHVAGKLRAGGIPAAALHGELSQGARTRTLAEFRAGTLQVVVATDLAARGLHIAELTAVVNHDLPRSAVDHVHRIGRTGRAGARGLAISFVSAATEAHFRLIEKRCGQRVPREQLAGFEPTELAPEAPPTGGVKGRRPSKKDKLRAAM